MIFVFFFQAEDGIRDLTVTGVQTCALPIFIADAKYSQWPARVSKRKWASGSDRKSTRLNSSHSQISYAVFCLKKKKDLGSAVRCASHAVTTKYRYGALLSAGLLLLTHLYPA